MRFEARDGVVEMPGEFGALAASQKDAERIAGRMNHHLAEIERLRAIVEKLPKTADGVCVVPGMKLYPLHPVPGIADDHGVLVVGIRDKYHGLEFEHGTNEFRVGNCYSTREAAKAALATISHDIS